MSQINEQTAEYELAKLSPMLKAANSSNTLLENLPVWLSAQTRKSAGRGRSADNTNQYGVQKLRELIIGLALRGKLTESNEMLHENIEAEIDNAKDSYFLCQSRAAKQWDHSEALIEEFEIPKGWRWKRIGMLCDLQTGATPSRNRPELFGGKIKWLVSGDINKVRIRECEGRITEEGLNSSNCKILPEGTVLIALNGQGKTRASTALLETKAACNQSLVGMIPFSSNLLDSSFLLLALQYRYYEIRDITGQKQRRGLNMKLVSDLSIPLAPIQTQRQIVKKVDELMAVCDQLEQQQADAVQAHDTLVKVLLDTLTQSETADDFQQNWRRIAEHFDALFTTESSIDKLKQTLLQLAVMGKLVLQDPNDEPVSVLITRVQEYLIQQTSSKHLPKLKRDKSVCEPEHYQHQVPSTWEWVELQGIFLFTNGKAHEQFVNEKGKFVLINSKFVSNSGRIRKHVSERLTPLETGDISIVMSDVPNGRALARCYLIEENDIYTLNQRIGGLKTSPELDRNYLLLALDRHPYMLAYNDGQKQTNLKKVQIMSAPVPIPPLAEQHRIVKKVDDLMALCNQLKDRLNQAKTLQQQLANAVVESTINFK